MLVLPQYQVGYTGMATTPSPGQTTTCPDCGYIVEEEKGMQKTRTPITNWPPPPRMLGGKVRAVIFEVDA